MWAVFALLSAVFAAATSILAKIGISGVDSNTATAIRTTVILVLAWGIVIGTGHLHDVLTISRRSMIFLVLSGLATGASWLFYFRALQLGDASRVVPIDKLSVVITMILAFTVLGEQVTMKAVLGGVLIAAGTFVMIL